ncbi:MAG: TetR/AcrR family transcriptional regulator [Deltaproteobacteria bacterium]|nr:TetR/AcrR family transcriptional regulator [Deltaproteobacteria bacterium]MBN2845577.1 TetR/AcrR family transcriptional regulator [Deltaproteobacteria bacterium]
MGPKNRREKEKEQRKKAILKAARKLFVKRGSAPVTVANIAKRADLSKGAIYLYFSSKEEICAQILLDEIARFHQKVAHLFDNGRTATEVLLDFSTLYIDFFLSDRELFRILMNFMLHNGSMDFTDDTDKRIILETNKAISVTERIFRYGIDKGEFFIKEQEVISMRNALWGLLNGVLSLHLFTGRESMREERIRENIKRGLGVFIEGLKKS